MKIREYLDGKGLIIQDLADVIHTSWTYAWMLAREKANPSAMVAHQIEIWTKGAIKVHEIRKCTRNCGHNCACSQGGF
jgi:hypothetical protein